MIKDILATKGSHVYSIGANATVLEAAELMNEHKIGALVVIDAGRVEGIFTERDVLRRVVVAQREPGNMRVGEAMTKEVACCTLDTTIEEARSVFKNRRIRHLPVVDENDQLAGMISIGDLNAHRADAQETTIYYLQEYLYGRT